MKNLISFITITLVISFGFIFVTTDQSYAASTPDPNTSVFVYSTSDFDAKDVSDDLLNSIKPNKISFITEMEKKKKKSQIVIVNEVSLSEDILKDSYENAVFVYDDTGKTIYVEIPREVANEMGIEKITGIIDDVQDGATLRIYNYQTVPDNYENVSVKSQENGDISTKGVGYIVRTGKAKKSGSEYKSTNKKICTVARGSSKTLGSKVSVKLDLQLSGSYFNTDVKSGFAPSVTFYSKTIYSGITPEVKSPNNARTFYLQTYRQNYTRKQTKVNAKTNQVIETKTATIKKGSSSAEYSVDVKI